MIHGCVTLDEVIAAAGVRAASLVPETSGYLALAVGDATSRLPYLFDERVVTLTTEGAVGITKRGPVVQAHRAAENLRSILARLLAVSTGTAMPGLSAAARPRHESERGVESVIEEIEAALIPVNRGAARRALARLARETMKARDSGHILPRPPARSARAAEPRPVAAAPPPEPVYAAAPRPATRPAPPPPPAPVYAAPAPVYAAPTPVYATPAPVYAAPAPIYATPVVAVAPPPPPLRAMSMAQVSSPPRQPMFVTPVVVVSSPALPFAPGVTPSPPLIELPLPPAPPPRDHTPTVLGIGAVAIRHPDPGTVLGTGAVEMRQPDRRPALAANVVEIRQPDPSPVLAVTVVGLRHSDPGPMLAANAVEPDPPTEIDVLTADLFPEDVGPARAVDLALGESVVFTQPTEDPALAFGMSSRGQALTPPVPLVAEARILPATTPVAEPARVETPEPARIEAAEPPHVETAEPARIETARPPRIESAKPSAARPTSTRADDLLASFGASRVDDQNMHEAAASLRRMAGVDPATPPPQRIEVRARLVPPPTAPSDPFLHDWETPEAPRARTARRSPAVSVAVGFAVLLIGVAGGGAVMRYRPDLLGGIWPAAPEVPTAKEAPAAPNAVEQAPQAPAEKETPAPTSTPATGDPAGRADRPGIGPRAERSGAERARTR